MDLEIEGDLEGLTFNNPESTPEFDSLNYYGEIYNYRRIKED